MLKSENSDCSPQSLAQKLFCQPMNITVTFISAIITGIIAHLYMFVNKLPNVDDVGAITEYGQGARVGRWFLEVLGETTAELLGNYSMPLFNGIMTVFFLALSACIVVKMFEITDIGCCIFVGAVFVCFPAVITTLMFMFTAPYYGLAVFLAVLAAWCISRERKYLNVCGVICLVLSTAIYQAYFPLSASILLAKLIQDVEKEKPIKRVLQYGGCFFVGLIAYFVSSMLFNRLFEVEMVSYKGADSMGQISVCTILENIPNTYKALVSLMTTGYMGLTEYRLLRILFALFIAATICVLIYKFIMLIEIKKIWRAISVLVFAICYPLAVFSLYFSGGAEGFYSIVMYPVVMFYILPVILLGEVNKESVEESRKRKWCKTILNYVMSLAMVGVIFLYCRFSNEYYLWMQMDYEQTSSYFTTLVTQIKESEGYTKDVDVVIVGYSVEDDSITGTDYFLDITLGTPNMLDCYNYRAFIQNYCGFGQINRELETEVCTWEEVMEMPIYPEKGSIQNIRGIIVVKVMEENGPSIW